MTNDPYQCMASALKGTLVPALKKAGYSGKFLHFRRDREDVIHFISICFSKYHALQPVFFLEAGAHPPGDRSTSWGEIVPHAKLDLVYVPADERVRLQQQGGPHSCPEEWFSYAGFGENLAAYEALALSVTAMLPQIEDWFAKKACGPNILPPPGFPPPGS